jgi:hypothetical protein
MVAPTWKDYERQIAELLSNRATGAVMITHDVKLPGRLSGTQRQIDILVEGSFAGIVDAVMIVDCKCFSQKVDVKDVENFIGLLDDVDVPLGMLVTTKGFSPAAEQRTRRVLKQVVPLVDIAVLGEASSWWLMRAGSGGRYVGDYVDHEPYGGFWSRVSFVAGDPAMGEDEDEDVLWASSEGGWDVDGGSWTLATLLARHRLARMPATDEVERLAAAIEHQVEEGQGFDISTSDVDGWMIDD